MSDSKISIQSSENEKPSELEDVISKISSVTSSDLVSDTPPNAFSSPDTFSRKSLEEISTILDLDTDNKGNTNGNGNVENSKSVGEVDDLVLENLVLGDIEEKKQKIEAKIDSIRQNPLMWVSLNLNRNVEDPLIEDPSKEKSPYHHHVKEEDELITLLNSLPEEISIQYKNEINKTINSYSLKRFISNKSFIKKLNYSEKFVLKTLDIKPVTEVDDEEFYFNFERKLNDELSQSLLILSPNEFSNKFRDELFKFHLESKYGIKNENAFNKINHLRFFINKFRIKLYYSLEGIERNIPDQISKDITPIFVEILKNNFDRQKKDFVVEKINEFLNGFSFNDHFKNVGEESIFEVFVDELNNFFSVNESNIKKELMKECLKSSEEYSEKEKSEVDFFIKWSPNIKQELRQGYKNASEALGRGVCAGICFNLLEEYQLDPHKEFDPSIKLNSMDRFIQSKDVLSYFLFKNHEKLFKEELSKEVMNFDPKLIRKKLELFFLSQLDYKKNFKDYREIFEMSSYDPNENDFEKSLQKPNTLNSLTGSNGWMTLNLTFCGKEDRHAILMRLDETNGKAWLFDPNVGMFCFESPEKPFSQAREDCLNCFKDLLGMQYKDTIGLKAFQYLPKSPE